MTDTRTTALAVVIKAGALALYDETASAYKNDRYIPWESASFSVRSHYMIQAELVIKAAFPHLNGYALGFKAGQEAMRESAARFIEKRRDDYIADHGNYDWSTGVTEFPGDGDEWVGEQDETAEAIRALPTAPMPAPPVGGEQE